ncbi:hypothetical protein DIPPA_05994 [Diplonema papillatum]|nr:hypothetical protein DIPPA_05994 [Diplonema papillatum]
MRRAVFVAAFAAAVQAGDVAVTERSGGEILPAADTYVFVCPSGAADAVGVPGTKLSVVAVWDKLAAEADCEQAEIDAALPKYLARVSSAEGPALLEAYGEHAVRLAPEYFIIATAETTPWKVRPRSVLLLLPFTRRVTHRRSATALDVYLPYKLGVMENILTPELKYLVQSLSGAREIQTLVDHTALFLSTRHTTSVDIKYAGIWIHEWLVEFGVSNSLLLSLELGTYRTSKQRIRNSETVDVKQRSSGCEIAK